MCRILYARIILNQIIYIAYGPRSIEKTQYLKVRHEKVHIRFLLF